MRRLQGRLAKPGPERLVRQRANVDTRQRPRRGDGPRPLDHGSVFNNPIALNDPTGELANVVIGSLIGGTIGVLRASFADESLGAGFLCGGVVGAVAGGTFGLGLPVLTAAGATGLAAFNLSILEQNITNILTGRKPSALQTIGTASAQGVATAATAALGGGLGRLTGDIGAEVSPGFSAAAGRLFSAGISAMSAIGQGAGHALNK